MGKTKGSSYVDCYHPDNDDLWCQLEVFWEHNHEEAVMYYADGSGYPGDDTFEITDSKMITYCGEPVQNMTEPHWINWDKVQEDLDTEI